MQNLLRVLTLAGCILIGAGCNQNKPEIIAGGSTFAYPMMSRWAGQYDKAKGVSLRYHAEGSGKGVEHLLDKSFDFGCTDAPMSDAALENAKTIGGEVVHIPLFFGAVVPAYNLDGIKEPLKFSGQVLAEIYLGKITKWNDRALKTLNPDVALPDEHIVVAHRSDSSGTTYIWTEYLSGVNQEWKDRVGFNKTVNWPTGVAANGNGGVAGLVKRTHGAIGYLELSTCLKEKIDFGLMENREGKFIKASPESIQAAVKAVLPKVPDDLRFSFAGSEFGDAYPITGATWAIAFSSLPTEKAKLVAEFLRWATHEGQSSLEGLGYSPLPQSLVERSEKRLSLVAH
jgi:phosphate ABC transporter phosphate-binding protein